MTVVDVTPLPDFMTIRGVLVIVAWDSWKFVFRFRHATRFTLQRYYTIECGVRL